MTGAAPGSEQPHAQMQLRWRMDGGQPREGFGGVGGQQIGHDLAMCAWSNPV